MHNPLISQDLRHFIEHLTTKPGVYQMKNAQGEVIYVGKAAQLKKRVSSYFNKNQAHPKTRALVSQITSIEVCVTQSETEALLLESNLIKSLRPKYNVLMRDDKSYPFIYISPHPFPSMRLVRAKKKPQVGTFFGPYPSAQAAKETLSMIQKIFQIRNCGDHDFSARTRPCLQHQIKRCSAPCTNYIAMQAYQQSLNDATQFLNGKCQQILEELAVRMDAAVEKLAFEEAARLRDQIKSLRQIQEQQSVVARQGDIDVVVAEVSRGFACVMCVTIRQGEVINCQSFFPSIPKLSLQDEENDSLRWQEIFTSFIAFYYLDTPQRIPPLLLIDKTLPDISTHQMMLTQLRGKSCKIQISGRGSKARWLDFARENLQLAVAKRHASAHMQQQRYQALSDLLQLKKPISRMVCFDISHTQGNETVASCVVFDESGPRVRDYRLFNIQGITPGDDYAAMEQALTRAFKRFIDNDQLPDILIIDGGKGQVGVGTRVLETLGVQGVFILGIAKGVDRKAGFERLLFNLQEITLPTDSQALHLLQHIRDEAHRFATKAHRKRRNRKSVHSSLENVPGVGPKRRQALLRRFGGMRELVHASIEELTKVSGINQDLAIRIHEYLKSQR